MFDVIQCIFLILIYFEIFKIKKENVNVAEQPAVYKVESKEKGEDDE